MTAPPEAPARYSDAMESTVRANRFAILTSRTICHACNQPLAVSALLVPAHFEREDGDDPWLAVDETARLVYVETVDDATRSLLSARAPQIMPRASRTAGLTYWANVCACGALQGDWYLGEPGGPFFPLDDTGIAAIDVSWVESPIEARAGTSTSSWTDALIARCPFPGWVSPTTQEGHRPRQK